MKNIGFIGAGNMGFAMMQGVIKKNGKEQIAYTDVNKERLNHVKNIIGIPYEPDNNSCIEKSDIIVLGIKPQYMEEVLKDIHVNIQDKIFIAIAPGITIDYYKKYLGKDTRVVRAMPNTPALVLEGMSAICFSEDKFSEDDNNDVYEFFNSFGETVMVTEKQLDMVVPVSGSSPAYVYMLIEAMADAGVLFGLPRDKAYKLAAQSVYGSAKMVLETASHPGALKDAVCSPGGTTIEAVAELEKAGFRGGIITAMKACYDKTVKFNNQ